MTPRVAVLEAFHPAMQETVRALAGPDLALAFPATNGEDDRAAALEGARYAVVRGVRMPARLLDRAPGLRLLHQWGTGTDHLPVAEAQARGILVARSPGRNAPTVADMTIGLMLACLRRIPQSDARVRAGLWADEALWEEGRDLTGATVGLAGFGAIAQLVMRRLRGFDARVLYTRAGGPLPDVPGFAPLDEMLPQLDVLSLHLPLTDATRGLIGAERLARLPRGAALVNTARGGIVDEEALVRVLEDGHLAAAGLDAFETEPLTPDSPLLRAPNCVLSPHAAGRTRDNLARMVRHWAGNIRAHAAGQPLDPGDLVLARVEIEG